MGKCPTKSEKKRLRLFNNCFFPLFRKLVVSNTTDFNRPLTLILLHKIFSIYDRNSSIVSEAHVKGKIDLITGTIDVINRDCKGQRNKFKRVAMIYRTYTDLNLGTYDFRR